MLCPTKDYPILLPPPLLLVYQFRVSSIYLRSSEINGYARFAEDGTIRAAKMERCFIIATIKLLSLAQNSSSRVAVQPFSRHLQGALYLNAPYKFHLRKTTCSSYFALA
jgi:hypothetical protein